MVNRGSLVKIDKSLPFDEAALFGCAVLTGVGAALNTAGVFPGSSVAVVGLGGVGLNALLGAKVAGAEQIIALDVHDDKLKIMRFDRARFKDWINHCIFFYSPFNNIHVKIDIARHVDRATE